MAETAPRLPEEFPELPSAERMEHLLPTAEQAEPLRKGEQDPVKALEKARVQVRETARTETRDNPLEQLQASEEAAKPAAPAHLTPELRAATLNRELKTIRSRLNLPQRTLSRIIHQRMVRTVSEPVGKTVNRPSGLLGGGIVAFAGSAAYLYLSRQSGIHYNYFVFLGLLAAGFLAGMALELLAYVLVRGRRRQ